MVFDVNALICKSLTSNTKWWGLIIACKKRCVMATLFWFQCLVPVFSYRCIEVKFDAWYFQWYVSIRGVIWIPQDINYVFGHPGVEARGGLVQKQELRVGDDLWGETQAPLLSAGNSLQPAPDADDRVGTLTQAHLKSPDPFTTQLYSTDLNHSTNSYRAKALQDHGRMWHRKTITFSRQLPLFSIKEQA